MTLAAAFRRFGTHECSEDPLYVALCQLVADHPDLAAGLAAAPVEQQRPNLWLAALHDRLLELGPSEPLAASGLGGASSSEPSASSPSSPDASGSEKSRSPLSSSPRSS